MFKGELHRMYEVLSVATLQQLVHNITIFYNALSKYRSSEQTEVKPFISSIFL